MTTDTKILKILYPKKNDNNFYDVSKELSEIPKNEIDNYVVGLEINGFVEKLAPGYIWESQIAPGDDTEDANNSICRITIVGVNYYDSFIRSRGNNLRSVLAIILSIIAVIFAALTYFKN